MGDRMDHLRQAVDLLAEIGQVEKCSSIYETDPWGFEDQPVYFNQVVLVKTSSEPAELLQAVKSIEHRIGRTLSFRYGPREIDIDILLFDDLILATPLLTIPHPSMKERAFVLVPLAEIVPQLIFSDDKENIAHWLERTGITGIRKV
jgi:2-amino-4-hydroxy-6-hydroxymethyldihydropteridine diphosphokinase